MKLLDANEVSGMGTAAKREDVLSPATRLAMATLAADKALEAWGKDEIREGGDTPRLEERSAQLNDLVEHLYAELSFAPTDNAFVACAQLDALLKAYHRLDPDEEYIPILVEEAKRQIPRILHSVLGYLKRLPDATAGGQTYENLYLVERWNFAADLRAFTGHLGAGQR